MAGISAQAIQLFRAKGNCNAILDLGSRLLLAGVFLVASLPKVLSPAAFAMTIDAYGLVPEQVVLPAAYLLSWGELATSFGLILGRKWAVLCTLGFMLVFISVLSYGIYLGLDIDCGCFGPEDPEHKAFSGLRTALIRDVLLLIPLCFSIWYGFINKRKVNTERRVK